MSDATPPIYEAQLLAYTASVQGWKHDHDQAMRCRQVEDVLRMGIALYDVLDAADEAWRLEYAKGDAHDLHQQFWKLFDWWLGPCDAVDAMIRECEAHDFHVEGADEFRRRWRNAAAAHADRVS